MTRWPKARTCALFERTRRSTEKESRDGGAHARDFVRGHGHAHSGAAHEEPAVGFPVGDHPRGVDRHMGVVDVLAGGESRVDDLVDPGIRLEVLLEDLFVIDARAVRCHYDSETHVGLHIHRSRGAWGSLPGPDRCWERWVHCVGVLFHCGLCARRSTTRARARMLPGRRALICARDAPSPGVAAPGPGASAEHLRLLYNVPSCAALRSARPRSLSP